MTETAVVEVGNSLPSPVVTLEVWAKRRADFNRFVNEQLRRGIDYGEVPGTDKPTLLKPGAEKIMQLYGCAVQLDVTRRDLDVATGHLSMEFTAKGISLATGQMVGMGVGSCSTYESKYRYRWVWWNGGGKPTGDEWEQTRNGKWRRRVENLDLADQWNTVLKMGKKRAMVDLALTISGASERFTQDIEDAATETENGGTSEAKTNEAQTGPWTHAADAQASFEGYLKGQSIEPSNFYAFASKPFGELPDKPATMQLVRDYLAAKKQG